MTLFEIAAKVAKARKEAEAAADYAARHGWSWSAFKLRELARDLNALENDLAQMEKIE